MKKSEKKNNKTPKENEHYFQILFSLMHLMTYFLFACSFIYFFFDSVANVPT